MQIIFVFPHVAMSVADVQSHVTKATHTMDPKKLLIVEVIGSNLAANVRSVLV
jgi:hypothetical protein